MPTDDEPGRPEHISNITRRGFVTAGSVATIAGLAGCSGRGGDDGSNGNSGGTDETPTDGSTNQRQEGVKGGNHLRVGLSTEISELNPMLAVKGVEILADSLMYSSLYRQDVNMEPKPDLAVDVTANADATQWTYTLNENATWHHNSEPVTAEDVKATFDVMYDPETGAPGNGEFGEIDTVEAVGDNKVRFNLKSPYAEHKKVVGRRFGRILPTDIVRNRFSELSSKEFGSGPFKMEEHVSGDHMHLVANGNYHKTDKNGNQLPYLDEITLKIIPESTAQANDIQAENVDILNLVPPAQGKRIKQISSTEFLQSAGGTYYPIIMGADTAPFDDILVRKAIKYAIDKTEIMEVANQGLGTLGHDTPVSPPQQNYVDLGQPFGPESKPDKAIEILEQAGYSDGLEIDEPLYAPPVRPQLPDTATVAQSNLAGANISIGVKQISWSKFLSDVETQKPFYVSYYPITPSAYINMVEVGMPSGAYYALNWDNKEFKQAVNDSIRTTDAEERASLLKSAMKILQERGPLIIPFYADRLGAQRNVVQNYEQHADGIEMIVDKTQKK